MNTVNIRKTAIAPLLIFFITEVAYSNCIDGSCECVDYCKDNGWSDFSGLGNAENWYGAASGKGYATGHIPQIGAVLVWNGWSKKDANKKEIGNPAGHVAIVASIVSDSEITVNHANWAPTEPYTDKKKHFNSPVKDVSGGKWTRVTLYGGSPHDVLGFIYPKNPPTSSGSICLGTVCGDALLYHAKLRAARMVLFGLDSVSVTDVGWRPLVDKCEEAQQYFYLIKDRWGSSKFRAVVAPNTICADVVKACFQQ